MNRRRLRAIAAAVPLLLAAGALAGCAQDSARADGRIPVVASTDVYGQIVEEIGGDAVAVTSIIDRPALDPHEYEASARDQLAVSRAKLVVVNGGGYDPFMDALIAATKTDAVVIRAVAGGHAHGDSAGGHAHAADEHPDHEPPASAHAGGDTVAGGDAHATDAANEHAFYDPAAMGAVADEIADALARLDPAHADEFAANAHDFAGGTDRLDAAIARLAADHEGARVFATEPLAGRLLAQAGLIDIAPPAFSEAAEAGQDVPPATLLVALRMLRQRQARVLIVNEQTAGAASERLIDAAHMADVPVVALSETLPRAERYETWMGQNIAALAKALDR